ncbi:MAG: oligosaccharide flippase family protein [Myxococcota bacterium]|nr:oligosaccharide flippase family protein [Myxococcota bacterium]
MSEDAASPAEGSSGLGAKAGAAAGWSLIGFAAGQVVRLAGNLILTRLLFPEAFGLMGLAAVLIQGLILFSDLGIGPSIIQNKEGDRREFLDTAWTMQVIRGVVLTLLTAAAAWPFARFYEDERLFLIVIVVGFSALFQGLNSTKVFTVGRHLSLKKLTVVEFSSQLIGVISMITWALLSPTYWALVAGALITPFSKMLLSHVVLDGPRDWFGWHEPSIRSLINFGKWIFISTAMAFFAGQSDRLIFAKLIPMDMLGVYSTGAMIALMPLTLFGRMERRVVFPVYSAVVRRGDDLAPIFLRLRAAYLTVGAVICAAFMAAGSPLIELMYDDRFIEAGWIVQYLTIGTWFTLLQSTYGAVHLATGRAQWVAASSFGKVIGIIALVIVGYRLADFPGAVLGYAFSEFVRYCILSFGGRKMKLPGLAQDFYFTIAIAAATAMGHFAGLYVRGMGYGVVLHTATAVAVSMLVWIPFGVAYLKPALELIRRRRG